MQIFRVKINNAGLLNVNGNYDVCKAFAKFPTVPSIEKSAANHHRHRPEFMYMHLAKDQRQGRELEFGIYLQPLPEMGLKPKDLVWVLAQINVGGQKADPILLYFAPRTGHDNVPPPRGWKPIGGIEPLPTAELIELTLPKKAVHSPLKKAMDAANGDISKMEELMFDLDKKGNAKLSVKAKAGPNVAKVVNMAPRHNIVQPGAKTKDMRRVRGE